MKNKINKIEISFLLVVILQIFLLMNLSAADSYFIHQADNLIEKEKNIQDKNSNLINTGINLLIGILSIKQIGMVSAGDSGCCFDTIEGLCTTSSLETECEDDGGQWDSDATCSNTECQKACCVLGTEAQFVTETRCEYLDLYYGYAKDFRDTLTEIECIALSASEFKGACVYNDKTCSIETEADCLSSTSNSSGNVSFYQDYLCSYPDLNTSCTKQASIGCYSDEDEIYWFDSCGNIENIYSSDTTASWNNGMMLSKEDSCNYGSSNADSTTCGNCDYSSGSMCSTTNKTSTHVVDGNYVCKNMNCAGGRDNGESWCVYDAYIGDSRDVAGSRHWKRYCIDGEIKVESCSDYRGQVCAETTIEGFSVAQCRTNMGSACFSITDVTECEAESDCRVESVSVYDYFYFSACVPKYPKGFDITSTDDLENGNTICEMGSQTCTVVYVKDEWGDWDCEGNCYCEGQGFLDQMNNFCISLGDCGGYVNIQGEYTKNYAKTGHDYAITTISNNLIEIYKKNMTKANTATNTPKYFSTSTSDGSYSDESAFISKATTANKDKYEKDFEDMLRENPVLTFLWPNPKIDLIVYLLYKWLGIGDTKKKYVSFYCYPWEPPVGGSDCSECNGNDLKPCSKYRCQSLGTACTLLNEDEENPLCAHANSNDTTPPVISAGEVLTEGYSFFNKTSSGVKIRQDDESCIQEFTDVSFTLKTNEYAKCKGSLENTNILNFENMTTTLGESNLFALIHTFNFSMPSIDSLEVYNISGDLKEMYGDMNMYVRCQDYNGNYNIKEYEVNFCINSGPDLTPPLIKYSSIQDGDYLKYNVTETSLLIYINEPAECNYDISDSDYDNMANSMSCNTDLTEEELNGWRCETTLTNLTQDSNPIYIRCKDQPWETNASVRNTNSESYSFTIYKTQYQLSIDSVLPDGEVESGFEPVAVDLEVQTSGGVDNGVSDCYYKWAGSWMQFFDTSSSYHKQESLNLMGGNFTIPIKCEDAYENIDYENISFMINVNSSPPVVINTSYEGDDLKLTTDEDAECYYDLETCYFDIDNSTSFTTALNTEHFIYNLNSRENYYVKCQDVWENSNPDCAIIINATETNDYTAPVAVRVYKKGSELRLITNELAKCYYDLNMCNFDLNNANSMTTEFSTEHSAAWNNGQTYYIQCIDDWDNSGCAITVKTSSLSL